MNNEMNYFKARRWAFSFIKENDAEPEAAERLLCDQMNWNEADLLLHFRDPIPENEWKKYQENVKKFVDGWPVQYLTGKAYFYGLQLKVNENTLIPRPETEELVEWILANNPDNQEIKVADIGTGTGAIGLALKNERPEWDVTLADISSGALSVARENAETLKEEVTLVESDLFQNLNGQYDILVSNPPYIAEDERKYMDRSVIEHEPNLAIFADDEGLAIYRRIAKECSDSLKPHSRMYFEIGFRQGKAVKKIFEDQFPDATVTVKQDINQHDRMVRVEL